MSVLLRHVLPGVLMLNPDIRGEVALSSYKGMGASTEL